MRVGATTIAGGIVAAAAAAGVAAFIFWLAREPDLQSTRLNEPSTITDLRFTRLETPKRVPPLSFVNGDGQPVTLADFHGRTVLLNIWATWCVPCRKEMPTLDRLESKLGGPDFEVIALSIDRRGKEVVAPFYRNLGIHALAIYLDPAGDAPHELDAVGVPTTLLIDPQGREVARKVGPAKWDNPEMIAMVRAYLPGSGAESPP